MTGRYSSKAPGAARLLLFMTRPTAMTLKCSVGPTYLMSHGITYSVLIRGRSVLLSCSGELSHDSLFLPWGIF